MASTIPRMAEYDRFTPDYDIWAADMTEDVGWYVELARAIGVDRSPAMLAVARVGPFGDDSLEYVYLARRR